MVVDLLVLRRSGDPFGYPGALLVCGSILATFSLGLVAASGLVLLGPQRAAVGGRLVVLLFLGAVGASIAGIALSTRELAAHRPVPSATSDSGGSFHDPSGSGGSFSTMPVSITQPIRAQGAGAARGSIRGCPTIVLYFSRGSGQAANGNLNDSRGLARPGLQLYDVLVRRYGTVEVGSMANGYRAVSIRPSRPHPTGALSYRQSVDNGVQSAVRNITDIARLCPSSHLVVGGFSQGAQVTRRALAKLGPAQRARIAAVVLFGDPHFSVPEPNVKAEGSEPAGATFDARQKGIGLRFARATPIDDSYTGKVFSWCHRRDLICQGTHRGNGWAMHKNYADDAEAATARIAARLRARGASPSSAPSAGAATGAYHVSGTCRSGPCVVASWSGPGTTSFARVDAAFEGQQLDIKCQAIGETVTGSNGQSSSIWDQLTDGSFVSDYYVDTPNVNKFSPPIPRCRGLDAGP